MASTSRCATLHDVHGGIQNGSNRKVWRGGVVHERRDGSVRSGGRRGWHQVGRAEPDHGAAAVHVLGSARLVRVPSSGH